MSSYNVERDLGYREGFEAGVEHGVKQFRSFGDLDKDTYYHLTKLFEHLGVTDQPKLVNKYKSYIIDEAKSFNEAR